MMKSFNQTVFCGRSSILLILFLIAFVYSLISLLSLTSHEYCDDCTCSCSKLFSDVNDNGYPHGQKLYKRNGVEYNHTSCGAHAYKRGSGQKVVSFTYFKDDRASHSNYHEARKYFEGITENLKRIVSLYPSDWNMRLYIDERGINDMTSICHDVCKMKKVLPDIVSRLDICDVSRNPMLSNASMMYPPMWRFLPIIDEKVDVAVFRDLDSMISKREISAITQWLNSKHTFHVMRDHPNHGTTPMMAGMWGVKIGVNPETRAALLKSFLAIMKHPRAYTTDLTSSSDQALLETYIWPWAKFIVLQHDAFSCQKYSKSRPWPTKRVDNTTLLQKFGNNGGIFIKESSSFQTNFVGSRFALNETIEDVCPKRCRPPNHLDWIHC